MILVLYALVVMKPNLGRIVIAGFFLLMAWGVNFVICLTNPGLFVDIGKNSILPFYQTIFTEIIAVHPLLWGLVVVAYESAVGGLMLFGQGHLRRLGLILGILFLIGIIPFGISTLPNAILALALQRLLDQPQSLPQKDGVSA